MATKKNKEINSSSLIQINPIGDNQKQVFDSWKQGKHQFLFGSAGTGKTFISLYLKLLSEIFNPKTQVDKVILVRSLIPTREIGFFSMKRIKSCTVSSSLSEHGSVYVSNAK